MADDSEEFIISILTSLIAFEYFEYFWILLNTFEYFQYTPHLK